MKNSRSLQRLLFFFTVYSKNCPTCSKYYTCALEFFKLLEAYRPPMHWFLKKKLWRNITKIPLHYTKNSIILGTVIPTQRRGGTSQRILTCQLRSQIPKDILIHDRRCELMIEDVINTFRNNAIKSFLEKFKLRQASVTESHTRKFDVNHAFSGYVLLLPNIQKVCTVTKAKTNKFLPKRCRFRPYTLDD